ncbi:MAG: hypothetical protein KHZ58_03660 [Hungatella hathewayi]|nr:hypothetical protein [Hungatella hathewayi]
MNRWRQITACTMLALFVVAVPINSFAAELSDYDEETQERLKDNKLEYDELEDLISVYNPDYKKGTDSIQESIDALDMDVSEIEMNIEMLKREADNMKDAGNMLGYQSYMTAAATMKASMLEMHKTMRKNYDTPTVKHNLNVGRYQLTSVAQMLMSQNQVLTSNREMAAKAEELAEEAYRSTQTQLSLNMGTEADLLNAKKGVEQSLNGLAQIDAGLLQMRQTLFMMTGWSYDANPEIGIVPVIDTQVITRINLEEDKIKAIGNNSTLIDSRQKDTERGTTASRLTYDRTMSEKEQKVCIAIEQLYDTLQQKRIESEAANAAFASAEAVKRGDDEKYRLGIYGKLEYLQAEVVYLTQKSAKEAADMALVNAYNDYQWGVKGMLTIE